MLCRPFDEQSAGSPGADPVGGSSAHHQEGAPNGTGQKNAKDAAGKKREEPKAGPKKPKEKVDALSQFDLNNYASTSLGSFLHLFIYLLVSLSWVLQIETFKRETRTYKVAIEPEYEPLTDVTGTKITPVYYAVP